MSPLIERWTDVRNRIERACIDAGRDPSTVRLIAVSKTFPIEPIAELAAAGQVDFGESYAQELRDKGPLLPNVRWHFIGRIQSNKAKYIAPHAYRVHAVADARHVDALAKRTDGPVPVLVSVNLGSEAQKGGVAVADTLDFCRTLGKREDVALKGLMCIPPIHGDRSGHYATLAELARRGRDEGLALDELSMGMSNDFEEAIRHGATWIRVGTAIFGTRTQRP
ncbi:MAG: YggS family pyridoxal phosphate-dependent enzyme [Proteobacteria bacterium]|nr:YggS family pyridoxal phosphate-dependent enzyme [Pseudomonadota bacterium]